jgi:PAS domain S-box-containing protein
MTILLIDCFHKIQNTAVGRIASPYYPEYGSLVYWRARILFSVLFAALILCTFATLSGLAVAVKENAWGLLFFDFFGYLTLIYLIFSKHLRYEIRASITLLMCFVTGIVVILSVGPLSGGAAWLFAFAVLVAVLLGFKPAILAILINASSLSIIAWLILGNKLDVNFVFFRTSQAMVAAGVNFVVLNAIVAVSVASLVKGLVDTYEKKGTMAENLEQERIQLIKAKKELELEIDERKQAEKALSESEEKYKGLVRYAPAGIFEFDMKKIKFVSVNDVMCQYTGYSEKEFLELDPFEILGDASKGTLNELVADVFSNQPTELSTEFTIRVKNQREYWVLANSRFFYEDGIPKRAMAVVHDLTHIRRAEEEKRKLETQLQNAKKLESLGTLAGGVAHDLNNILSGVVSYPDLILLDLEADSPLRKPLLTIKQSGEKAAEIVQDLLTLARRGVASRKVIDLNQVVNEFLGSPEYHKILMAHENIRIETNLNKDILNIVGSRVHISKTLMNLVANAVDAMPAGGKAMIETNSCYLDTVYNGYESIPEGEYTTLEISDIGIGIAPSDLEKIFEPFYTKKTMGRSGTGLGMSVVWGTVKDHDGYIDISTEEGSGTTFILYFPTSRSEIQTSSTVYIEDYIGKGESILVVDDSPEQRALAQRMMQRLGYEVYTAASGEEAVSLVNERKYDLLILDMIMPPGMDGLETYKQILKIVPDQKAVIASGYTMSEYVHEAQQMGAGGYIKKPFTLEKIGLAVRAEFDLKN